MSLSFDDLIPQDQQNQSTVKFDDLVPKPKPQTWEDFGRGAVGQAAQGITFGWFDEGLAALGAAMGYDYDESLKAIRATDKAFVDQNPGTALAANIGGGLVSGGAAMKAGTALLGAVAPKTAQAFSAGTASLGGRVAGYGAGGAAGGAAYGAGSSEGRDLTQTGIDTAKGAILGGGLGAAAPVAMSALSGVGRAAQRLIPADVPWLPGSINTSDRAAQTVGMSFLRNAQPGDDLASATQASAQFNKPVALADLPELQQLGGAVARSAGRPQQIAGDFLGERQVGDLAANAGGQWSRVLDDLSATISPNVSARRAIESVAAARSDEAKALYDPVFQMGSVQSDRIAALMQIPAFKMAMQKGASLAKTAREVPPNFDVASDPFNLRVLHYTKMALDDVVEGARNSGAGNKSRAFGGLKNELIDAMDEATTVNGRSLYQAARDAFAGKSALISSAKEGQKFRAKTAEDIADDLASLKSQSERDFYLAGAVQSLRNMVTGNKVTANIAQRILSSPEIKTKLQALAPGKYDELVNRLTVESRMGKTMSNAFAGSPTQPRIVAEADTEALIQGAMPALPQAGSVSGAVRQAMLSKLAEVAQNRAMSERVRTKIAEMIFTSDPAKIQQAARLIDGAARTLAKGRAGRARSVIGVASQSGNVGSDPLRGLGAGIGSVGAAWDQGDTLDRAAMLSSPIPGVGDIAGVANDLRNYQSGKLDPTWTNMGLTAAGALPFVPSAAMFLGATARTAEKSSMKAAQKLAQKGARPELILKQTGWSQGVDGKWRFELDDSTAKMMPRAESARTLPDALDHPKLFAAYPELRNVKVTFEDMPAGDMGSFDGKTIALNKNMPEGEKLNTILHEVQHWVQGKERFAPGGNPLGMTNIAEIRQLDANAKAAARQLEAIKPQYDAAVETYTSWAKNNGHPLAMKADLMPGGDISILGEEVAATAKKMRAEFAKLYPNEFRAIMKYNSLRDAASGTQGAAARTAYGRYGNLAGEVEARNVETRRTMTDAERRATLPQATEDATRATQMTPKPAPWYSDYGVLWGRPSGKQIAYSKRPGAKP